MSSAQKVRDKIKMLRTNILEKKLQKLGTSTQKLKNKLNGLMRIKNGWKTPRYYIHSINSVDTKVPRAIAKNNVGKVKTKRSRRVTFKNNFILSNSPLKGSPLYSPFKNRNS